MTAPQSRLPNTGRAASVLAALAAATSLAAAISATPVAACACCAEPGARFEGRVPFDGGMRDELARIAFSSSAWLYTTAAFPEGTKGLAEPQTERYRATWSTGSDGWRLTLESKSGKRGTLGLPRPSHVLKREMHIPPQAAGGTPTKEDDRIYDEQRDISLYREWHLVGPVSGEGPLVAAIGKAAKARLILHGQGNSCASSIDFYFWTLIVTGPNAGFTLMGRLAQPR